MEIKGVGKEHSNMAEEQLEARQAERYAAICAWVRLRADLGRMERLGQVQLQRSDTSECKRRRQD